MVNDNGLHQGNHGSYDFVQENLSQTILAANGVWSEVRNLRGKRI